MRASSFTIGMFLALAACSIPKSNFSASLDGGAAGGGDDQGPDISILTSLSSLAIDEGGTATLQIHLSAPPTGDLVVTALLDDGPVTITPSTAVFTATNFDADQIFTLNSAIDSNTISENQVLTFRADGVGDKALTVQSVDKDVQNIKVTPASATIKEQSTTAAIQVSLTQQPSAAVVVTVAAASGKAHVDIGQLTFTAQNYATVQTVTVSGPSDADTHDDTDTIQLTATDPDTQGSLSRTVAITITDDDRQQILEDAPAPLAISESTMSTFNATLQFMPDANLVVNVASLDPSVATATPATLTFTPTDYNQPHVVTVKGVSDANLATNQTTVRLSQAAIGMTDVAVSVADVDHQVIKLSTGSLSVVEGSTGSFGVSLMFDPGAAVKVTLVDDNAGPLPIDLTSIMFDSTNYATPVLVHVKPPIDSNATSETATVTASGGGATATASLMLTATDTTVITQYGFPTPFTSTASLGLGEMIAYKITTNASATLDSFGVYIPSGSGDFRMAIYADGLNAPGTLVASMPVKQAIVGGINIGNIADVALPTGTYWIAFRGAQTTAVGLSTTGTGPECVALLNISNIDTPWPTSFGNANCSNDNYMNFFITTYHQ